MKHFRFGLVALAASAAAAHAGGIDRSGQSIAALFETGNYAELSFSHVAPDVTGTAAAGLGGFSSGDMAGDYNQIGLAIKTDLRPNLAFALILDQPFGAKVDYPAGTNYYAQGSTAQLNTTAITGALKYTLPNNISLIGGLRMESMSAKANIPFVASYTASTNTVQDFGYVVGVAYEKPEIALRVALTYSSKIKHGLNTTESSLLTGGADVAGTTSISSPQSVNLEFQSGVAKNTLVFGSIRWVDWTGFVIDPANYPPPSPLVSYDGDVFTYTLGVGHKFSDHLSGALSVGYDTRIGGFSSNLGPTDGKTTVTVGVSYTKDKFKISGGISYVMLGNTQTTLDGATAAATFKGNKAIGVGMKIGYAF